MKDDSTKPLSKVIRIDESEIRAVRTSYGVMILCMTGRRTAAP